MKNIPLVMKMEHKINTQFGIAKFNESTGYYIVQSAKRGLHNRFLHHLIWETHYNKPIPTGCVIHHINNIKTDNRIQNLVCVPKKIHDSFHSRHRSKETIEKIRIGRIKKTARIVKDGYSNGKQRYVICKNTKKIKGSVDYQKLIRWFEENYPDEKLELLEDF